MSKYGLRPPHRSDAPNARRESDLESLATWRTKRVIATGGGQDPAPSSADPGWTNDRIAMATYLVIGAGRPAVLTKDHLRSRGSTRHDPDGACRHCYRPQLSTSASPRPGGLFWFSRVSRSSSSRFRRSGFLRVASAIPTNTAIRMAGPTMFSMHQG